MNAERMSGRRLAVLSVILGLGLTIAGSASALSIEEIANLTGPDRQRILEEGAKKEGALLWVGSFNEDNAKPIIDAFNARYPYVKVERVRTDSTKALQRVLAEVRAKTPHTDLITSSSVIELRQADAVQSFRSPVWDTYPAEDRDPAGYAAPLYFQYNGMAAYNTDQVKESEAPKTYDDLLDPKWRGHLVWASSTTSGAPFFITFLRMHWGEAKTLAYLEKLAKQKVVMRDASARTVLGMMVSGEHKIMISPFLTHVGEAAKKKAPIGVSLQDPVPYSASPFLLSKHAPHPHATMLMIDHLLDKEVQTILSKGGYYPAHPGVAPAEEMQPYLPKSRGLGRYLVDNDELSKMTPETMNIYTRLFE